MTLKEISLTGFNEEHKNINTFLELKEQTYLFNVVWNSYCDCAFLSISDYEDNPIIVSKALVNGLVIRHNKLPYKFLFIQKNGETYEPQLDIIGKEYVLLYDDEEIV